MRVLQRFEGYGRGVQIFSTMGKHSHFYKTIRAYKQGRNMIGPGCLQKMYITCITIDYTIRDNIDDGLDLGGGSGDQNWRIRSIFKEN